MMKCFGHTKNCVTCKLYKAYLYLRYFKEHIAEDIRACIWKYIKDNGIERRKYFYHDKETIEHVLTVIIKSMINPLEIEHLRKMYKFIKRYNPHVDAFVSFDEFLFDIVLFGDQLYYTIYDLKEIILERLSKQ